MPILRNVKTCDRTRSAKPSVACWATRVKLGSRRRRAGVTSDSGSCCCCAHWLEKKSSRVTREGQGEYADVV